MQKCAVKMSNISKTDREKKRWKVFIVLEKVSKYNKNKNWIPKLNQVFIIQKKIFFRNYNWSCTKLSAMTKKKEWKI